MKAEMQARRQRYKNKHAGPTRLGLAVRTGGQRKVGKLMTGGGCAVVIASGLALSLLVCAVVGVAVALVA